MKTTHDSRPTSKSGKNIGVDEDERYDEEEEEAEGREEGAAA